MSGRKKHSVLHHGYSIALYNFVILACLYIVVRLILCLKARGTCRRVADTLKVYGTTNASQDSEGSGHVNINIKTSNESITLAPAAIPLRTLPPSGNRDAEPETHTSRRLRCTSSYF